MKIKSEINKLEKYEREFMALGNLYKRIVMNNRGLSPEDRHSYFISGMLCETLTDLCVILKKELNRNEQTRKPGKNRLHGQGQT